MGLAGYELNYCEQILNRPQLVFDYFSESTQVKCWWSEGDCGH